MAFTKTKFMELEPGDIVTIEESGFQPDDFEVVHVTPTTIYVMIDSVEHSFKKKDGVGRGSKRIVLTK